VPHWACCSVPPCCTAASPRPTLREPAHISADYLAQRGQAGFDLLAFVHANFQPPPPPPATPALADAPLQAHIDALWPALSRQQPRLPAHSSLLPLPHPYVVPGGRFGELYYWDSYFTMLGLYQSGQGERARAMLQNFAYLIDSYGHIPNGTRSYYLSRSQPPFFSWMVELEAEHSGDASTYVRYLPQLRAEYAYWMAGADSVAAGAASRHVVRLRDGSLLNRYWDARDTPRPESYLQDVETAQQASDRPASEVWRDLRAGAESGWDFSSRWLGDRKQLHTIRTTAIVPIDLNSLLHHLETTLAHACRLAESPDCGNDYQQRADARAAAINRHLWNRHGYYADYDWQQQVLSDQLSAAAAYPLFAGIATPRRARQVAKALRNQLLEPGGLVTTALQTGQQWDAPNAWAPLQWIAVSGLRRYDQQSLAADVAGNFLAQVQALYAREHKLVEKYDARGLRGGGGGEYPLQDGFGWTNGVVLKLLALYPQAAPRIL
jgi:alpha,alpha-trehalase